MKREHIRRYRSSAPYALPFFVALALAVAYPFATREPRASVPSAPPQLAQAVVPVALPQQQVPERKATPQGTSTLEDLVSFGALYPVLKVRDGDTFEVEIDGKPEPVRLIGVNTPETVHPSKPVECFGKEASNKLKALLTGTSVALVADPTQGDRDHYGRLLRYVYLPDGTFVNKSLIAEGFAHEATYDIPYKYQADFRKAQAAAKEQERGLWGSLCKGKTDAPAAPVQPVPANGCTIKGNVSVSGAKIYHMPGCGSYDKTSVNESAGERWFCSEQEAQANGWRKARNCH